ncbi:MAG: aspartate aminotransferase family protein [Thermoprotei archaeon]
MKALFPRLYGDRKLTIVKAEGQYVYDDKGNKYVDAHTGIGVAFLGHRNPKVVEYLRRQMDSIMTLNPSFTTPIREEMLKELDPLKPEGLDNVLLLNSGTEAVEFALKVAKKVTGRKKIVAFKNAFHGRTAGALAVTWNRKYREPFEPLMPETYFIDYNNVDSLKAIDDTVAAVIVEPIQGEGGVIPAKEDFMKELRAITEKVGALLIVDEIQTGFGRTGKVWAHQHYGIKADIVLAAKAFGGGFPVSGVFVPDWIAEKLEEGDHGSTYGGNPMAMAAVTAAAKVLKEENVQEQARTKGETLMRILKEKLADSKVVREIRGKGLMIGVDVRFPPGPALQYMQENKRVLAVKAGSTTIRLLPPYLINAQDMEAIGDAVREGVSHLASKGSAT